MTNVKYPYMREDGIPVADPLFQDGKTGLHPTSPLQFALKPIPIEIACQLNAYWHSRLPSITRNTIQMGQHACYALEFNGGFYGCAIWSPPVARLLANGNKIMELRRMALGELCPRNTASRFIAVMVRDLKSQFSELELLISYQDEDVHQGTIYKASNWTPVNAPKGGTKWGSNNYSKGKQGRIANKVRWELKLKR